jgi:hypothetical protein
MIASSDSLNRLVHIVARHNGITAGKAGFEAWYRPGNEVRHENTCATMHCRAAGKLLARAERLGLVRHRQHGPAKLWYANARPYAPERSDGNVQADIRPGVLQ